MRIAHHFREATKMIYPVVKKQGGYTMQNINIVSDDGKMKVYIDGILIKGLRSFFIEYIDGCPLQFSCVTEIGEPEKQRDRLLH